MEICFEMPGYKPSTPIRKAAYQNRVILAHTAPEFLHHLAVIFRDKTWIISALAGHKTLIICYAQTLFCISRPRCSSYRFSDYSLNRIQCILQDRSPTSDDLPGDHF